MLGTILVDNREQKPYTFDPLSDPLIEIKGATLTTGDYTLLGLCDHDDGTYHPNFAVERKSGPDLLNSVTHGRERFSKEIDRASHWEEPLVVVVERPRSVFKENKEFMYSRDIQPSQVIGTVDSWEDYRNVSFEFVNGRKAAQQLTFDTLMDWHRQYA